MLFRLGFTSGEGPPAASKSYHSVLDEPTKKQPFSASRQANSTNWTGAGYEEFIELWEQQEGLFNPNGYGCRQLEPHKWTEITR